MTAQRHILDQAGRLIDAIGRAGFPRALRDAINALAPIDSFIVLAYHARRTPVILHDELRPEERDVFFEHYLSGAYLLSPFYQACMSGTDARFHLISEIVPDGFYESEFCKVYYAPAGIVDEGGYTLPHGSGGALMVSIGRVQIDNAFEILSCVRQVVGVGFLVSSLAAREKAGLFKVPQALREHRRRDAWHTSMYLVEGCKTVNQAAHHEYRPALAQQLCCKS